MDMTRESYNFKVTWQPFFLRPNMPPEGVPKPATYGPNTPGSQRLINIGKQVGIDFSYKSDRFPNTMLSHCALEYALEQDPAGKIQNELQEKLFNAYFTDGKYLGSDLVCYLAGECGLPMNKVKSFIEDPKNQDKISQKARQNSEEGVTGVPFFIINGQGMISGAQDPETLARAFEIANTKFPLKQPAASSS